MTARIEPNAEPIPGYRLIERLGVGGFGEVWKCEAPGGLFKAIKVVHGELGESDNTFGDESSRADQELKALKRVKTVHHPYILSLERFDIVGGQLMIVMELADRTLWDRFKECRTQGLPGIPRQELLGYMRETAEALDLMNDQFQLQHLDIKPQNLFLVFNHVKVADFGLVKDLGTKATATITGGVTPVYAAPETFDGWLSRFSDQYSLAIVYQELLSGQRPFGGATMRQLVLQHLQGSPDLTPLPASDRAIIARALSKDPEGRFPNCLEFVRQLQLASPAALAETDAAVETTPQAAGHTEGVQTRDLRREGREGRPSNPDLDLDRAQVLPPRPGRSFVPVSGEGQPVDETPPVSIGHSTVPALRRDVQSAAPFVPGPIQPALVIGLGGFGVRALAHLRQVLTAELGRPEELNCIRLLGMDTDPNPLQSAGTPEPTRVLQGSELMTTKLHRASHYLKPAGGKSLTDSWLNSKLLYRIPRNYGSAGLRPLGRLAFVDSVRHIHRRLETELEACSTLAAQVPTRPALAPRGLTPRVYIATCLAGNTGSGMFLDVACSARELLRKLGHHSAEVVGLFFVPASDSTAPPTALANAYAALTELNHYSRHGFIGRYDTGDKNLPPIVVQSEGSPFARCVMFTLPRHAGGGGAEAALTQVLTTAGEYLYRDLATPLGQNADEQRQKQLREAMPQVAAPALHVVGVSRLSWPRQALLEQGARRISRRLVEGWMSKDARAIADEMGRWADETWDAAGVRPEALINRLHELCEKIVKQPPDKLVTAITGPLAEVLTPKVMPGAKPGETVQVPPPLGPAVAALAELDRLLGVPEECRATNQAPPPPGVLESALAEATTKAADGCEQCLAEQVVRLIEDPRYRLAGAEEALRKLSAIAERALSSQETLARELNERAALLYQRVQRALESPPPPVSTKTNPSGWKLSFGRTTPHTKSGPSAASAANELLELMRQYPKARYHALVLTHINRLYVGLRGQLSDQLREIGFCRQRLGELSHLVAPTADATLQVTRAARVLLPVGCATLEDALEQLDRDVKREDLLALDQQIQALVRQNYRALVTVCMGSSAMVRSLAPAMLARTREFLAPRFGGTSVAELLLHRDGAAEEKQNDHAAAELQKLYERAAPKSGASRPDAQFAVAVLPGDTHGTALRDLVRDDLPDVTIVTAERPDEIVFCREHVYLTTTGAEQLGSAAQDAYRQRLAADPAAVHAREDVGEWEPAAALAR